MMQINKTNKEDNKFITDFSKLSDDELEKCCQTNRNKLLDMMALDGDELEQTLLKVSACYAIMDSRNICHD